MPLGVLKAGYITFQPKLPQDKKEAIESLGSGVLDKLIIRFSKVFWNPESDWFNFISETPYEWTQTLNLYKFTKEPILIMFNCERSAHKFSRLSD